MTTIGSWRFAIAHSFGAAVGQASLGISSPEVQRSSIEGVPVAAGENPVTDHLFQQEKKND